MKRNFSTLAAGLLFLLTSSAMAARPADTSNPTDKARASFHHGVQLYNEGSFEAALAEFRRAYQISPNYRLLYNIAQTYFDLHDYVNSSKNLKQYLQEGGNEIAATRRLEVSDLNQKLEDRIAYLDIVCNLDGADIRVDDLSVGVSPLTSAVPVNAGPRRISAVKLGHPVAARMATVVGREKAKVIMDIAASAETQAADRVRGPAAGAEKGMAPPFVQSEPDRKASPRKGLITSTCDCHRGLRFPGVERQGRFQERARQDAEHQGQRGQCAHEDEELCLHDRCIRRCHAGLGRRGVVLPPHRFRFQEALKHHELCCAGPHPGRHAATRRMVSGWRTART